MSSGSSNDNSVSEAIKGVRDGHESAASKLWSHFSGQMLRIARGKIFAQHRRFYDAEEIVNSAFADIILQLWEGQLEEVRTRNDIWRMLSLALRNAHENTRKHHSRLKRGGGELRGDSAFQTEPPMDMLTPDARVAINHDFGALLDALPEDPHRQTALMRIAGHTIEEIANELNVSPRSVARLVQKIRQIWAAHRDGPPQSHQAISD